MDESFLSVFQCFAGGYIKILNSNISENYTLELWITIETKMWTILKNLLHVGEKYSQYEFFKNATCILTNKSGYMALKVKVICISIIQRTCNVDLSFYNHLETAIYKSEIM